MEEQTTSTFCLTLPDCLTHPRSVLHFPQEHILQTPQPASSRGMFLRGCSSTLSQRRNFGTGEKILVTRVNWTCSVVFKYQWKLAGAVDSRCLLSSECNNTTSETRPGKQSLTLPPPHPQRRYSPSSGSPRQRSSLWLQLSPLSSVYRMTGESPICWRNISPLIEAPPDFKGVSVTQRMILSVQLFTTSPSASKMVFIS